MCFCKTTAVENNFWQSAHLCMSLSKHLWHNAGKSGRTLAFGASFTGSPQLLHIRTALSVEQLLHSYGLSPGLSSCGVLHVNNTCVAPQLTHVCFPFENASCDSAAVVNVCVLLLLRLKDLMQKWPYMPPW